MVAGFFSCWLEQKDYRHAFHMGIAAGSGSAFSEALATRQDVENVYRQVVRMQQEADGQTDRVKGR